MEKAAKKIGRNYNKNSETGNLLWRKCSMSVVSGFCMILNLLGEYIFVGLFLYFKPCYAIKRSIL